MRTYSWTIWVVVALMAGAAWGTNWHVAPDGLPTGAGTAEAPWDIASALAGEHRIAPGDTIYLRAGTYRRRPDELFAIRLTGEADRPIHVRPEDGAHVIIDGGLVTMPGAAHVWVWDLEVLVSEPQPAQPVGRGNNPPDFTRPWGGIVSQGGVGCKFIHLSVHDCREGARLWAASQDDEVYGCIFYDNGWEGIDGGHGSAINTTNRDGVKTVADCIFTGGHYCTWHPYGGPDDPVDNYRFEGNITYDAKIAHFGGKRMSHGIHVVGNCFYRTQELRLGWSGGGEDLELRGNLLVDTRMSTTFQKVDASGNTELPTGRARPKEPTVMLRPSRYDACRAHLAVFNWQRTPTVAVDLAPLLTPGDHYRLLRPRDVYGAPVMAGVYEGTPVMVPVAGEFAAFVVYRQPAE